MTDPAFPSVAGRHDIYPGHTLAEITTPDGLRAVFTVEYDSDASPPWEDDGHGPVSDWETRPKRAGELILHANRSARRYYDFAEACRIALADGWGYDGKSAAEHVAAGLTRRQVAANAARADFAALRAWCRDDWYYAGVVVTISDAEEDVELASASIWRVDVNYPGSDNAYIDEIAADVLADALHDARARRARIAARAA